jgi:hypothetical protein
VDVPETVVVGALQGRTGAFLTVGDAASRVSVVMATLPGLLFRVSAPAGSGLRPWASSDGDGHVRVELRPTGQDGPDEVRIVLNRDVRWDIRLPAGAGEEQLDLRRGRIARVDLGAAGLVELRLPRPRGTVPVTMLDDAGSLVLSADPATELRFRSTERVIQTPGWATVRDRYAVHAKGSVELTIQGPPTGPEAR